MEQSFKLLNKSSYKIILKKRVYFQTFIIFTVFFLAVLIILVKSTDYFKFDLVVTNFIQLIDNGLFNLLMVVLSRIGDPIIGWPLVVVIFWLLYFGKFKKNAYFFLISFGGAVFLGQVLKMLIQRPRPSPILIIQQLDHIGGYSFPSGHVLFYIGVFGFLGFIIFSTFKSNLFRSFLLVLVGILLFLIGVSRIYLGAHWLSDVMGSYLLGFLYLLFVIYLYRKI